MGKDLMNPDFGPRYVKYSDNHNEHGFGQYYIGEWSTETNKPQGRGIHINSNWIHIGYSHNGRLIGKYIEIWDGVVFKVGEYFRNADGIEDHKYMRYEADGTSYKVGY